MKTEECNKYYFLSQEHWTNVCRCMYNVRLYTFNDSLKFQSNSQLQNCSYCKRKKYWNITTHSFSVKKNPPSLLTITKKHTLDIQKMWFKYFQKSALIIIYIATLKDFVIAIKILIHFLCELKKLKFKKRKHLKQFWNQCSYSNYNSMTSYPGMG